MKQVLLITLTVSALALTASCGKQRNSAYRFEPAPRPVVAKAGISASRNGVAADWITVNKSDDYEDRPIDRHRFPKPKFDVMD
jgi:hypothetical protein